MSNPNAIKIFGVSFFKTRVQVFIAIRNGHGTISWTSYLWYLNPFNHWLYDNLFTIQGCQISKFENTMKKQKRKQSGQVTVEPAKKTEHDNQNVLFVRCLVKARD